MGLPLVGDAGATFNRVLRMLGRDRGEFRLHNTLSCFPPRNWLERAPWEVESLAHCRPNLLKTLAEGPSAVCALGGVAMRSLLEMPRGKKASLKEFHGAPVMDPSGRFWVVSTFHPSHIQRGAYNLLGVVLWDIQRALEVSQKGWTPDEPVLVEDPDPGWFADWAAGYLEAAEADPGGVWLAVDIETPDKAPDEGELKPDQSWSILRLNLSCHPDEGITVPWQGPWREVALRVLASPGVKVLWNWRFDVRRLEADGARVGGEIWDAMDAWHALQSDTPRGLGFVAPFYSAAAPWKHLATEAPAAYAAKDGAQTLRVMMGVAKDLEAAGQWEVFSRHLAAVDQYALGPAEQVGLLVDQEELPRFTQELRKIEESLLGKLRAAAPPGAGVDSKEWLTDPGPTKVVDGVELPVLRRVVRGVELACQTCGESGVQKRHRCKETYTKRDGTQGLRTAENLTPQVVPVDADLPRWYVRLPFNPASPQQVLEVVKGWGLKLSYDRKTQKPTTNKITLQGYAKSASPRGEVWGPEVEEEPRALLHGEPRTAHVQGWFRTLLQFREVAKVEGTYATGTEKRLAAQRLRGVLDDRLHSTYTNKPSTFRLSSQAPNLTNVVADRGGPATPAAGFRRCVVAAPGCLLVEADFAAIEAVMVGWFAADPVYYRLAKLGVHAYLTSHLAGAPADLAWPDERLTDYFHEMKGAHKPLYNQAKKVVHGSSYGLTPFGMRDRFPDIFPSVAAAQRVQELFFALAPRVRAWQQAVVKMAARQNYLGGPGAHPFSYKHWFWNCTNYSRITEAKYQQLARLEKPVARIGNACYAVTQGDDAKRAIAFFPQSTAAGIIRECALRLFVPGGESYIGEEWHGRTPLRALIHDSFLLEVPEERVEAVIRILLREMRRPVEEMPLPWAPGKFVELDASVAVGKNWAPYNIDPKEGRLNPEGMREWAGEAGASEVARDTTVLEEEEDEEEEEGGGLEAAV